MAKQDSSKKITKSKNIVYLIGAGASHAEISSDGVTDGLIMSSVTTGILDETVRRLEDNNGKTPSLTVQEKQALNRIRDILSSVPENQNIDVEQLITLCEYSELPEKISIADNLRTLFRDVTLSRIHRSQIEQPKLMSALIDLHEITDLNEQLCGILTLNYDNFIEKALRANGKRICYGIDLSASGGDSKMHSEAEVTLLKLHGSFDWKRGLPISIKDEIENESDVLWIPPGVAKNYERYPFNIIWGKAAELLCCDILRVIGCSLNRNDWGLVTLLYTSIMLMSDGHSFPIELINYLDDCVTMKNAYVYLDNMKSVIELPVIRQYYQNTFLPAKSSSSDDYEISLEDFLKRSSNPQLNVFDFWLRAKGDELERSGASLMTASGIFRKYIYNEP